MESPKREPQTGATTASAGARRGAAEVVAGESAFALAYHIDEMVRVAAKLDVRPRRSSFWRSWSWLVLTFVALVAFVLAVHYARGGSLGHRLLDALKLFPSGWPGYQPNDRWQYLLAKHLAAL